MWLPSNKLGFALFNWHGNVRFGLPLEIGDSVEILEECPEWYRGKCYHSSIVGIFPKSFIYVKDFSTIDPVVFECNQVLREWSDIWKKLYVDRETYKFQTLRKVMFSILESRRELFSSTLTHDQLIELQMTIVSKIDWGNRKLGLDLVPRIGPLTVDPCSVSLVELYNFHVCSADNAKASSSRGTLRGKSHSKVFTHHLYFCLNEFGYRAGNDDIETYFFLFDGNPHRLTALSERFLIKIPRNEELNYHEVPANNRTVFADLGVSDLTDGLFVVAVVVRMGKILQCESIKKGDKHNNTGNNSLLYKRPFGVGVLSLADICRFDTCIEAEEKQYSFKIYQCEEKDFHQLHELIIKKTAAKCSPIPCMNQGINVSVKLISGELNQAEQEHCRLLKGTPITRKIGFPDVIMPGDVRNDLFFTIEKGEFEKGGKNTAKNIMVTVLVLDKSGNTLLNTLWGASGLNDQMCYRSLILYHQNMPTWNEMLRLSVPIDKFSIAHVRFEFRHCSTREKSEPKLFGFSFVRLMEPSGVTLADGNHGLYVYKCEDLSKLNSVNYLKLPSSAREPYAKVECSSAYHRSSKEIFTIKSLLCSTKLTQNVDLLSLLQWRTHPEKIQDSLTGVLRLNDEELVKFLQDVLDALFAMFSNEEGNSTTHSGLVFHVLVSIFSLLQSNKFQHFRPVMDAYIKNHFAAALVYKGLITSVEHMAIFMTKAEHPDPFQKCFGSLEYIFKLLIQSRKLFARATGGQYEDSFRRDLHSLFCALNGMLSVPSYDVIISTQEALLKSLSVVLEQLKDTLPAPELGMLARNMLDAVPRDAPLRLVQAKLNAVKDLVSGELFQEDDFRTVILSVACKHLRVHLGRRDELSLCAEIITEILCHLHSLQREQSTKASNSLHHDLDSLCQNILGIFMKTILAVMNSAETILPKLVACFLGLLQLLDETHFQRLWDELSPSRNPVDLKEFINKFFLVFEELLSQGWAVFPRDWVIMKFSANEVIRKTLEEFAKPLVFRFLPQKSFDYKLWWSYFNVSVLFLTQPILQLEDYRERKRRKILKTYGDMRVLMGFQMLSMWSQLGEQKLHFIPSMVGPFLEVTLVPERNLRKATIPVFYDMIHTEQISRGSFRLVESELIDKLDLLISENKGDDQYRDLFGAILLERIHDENPNWKADGTYFIKSVTKLLERLLDYRSVMQGEENQDKRMSCTVNLLNFYKNEIKRKEIYIRYIYKLHDLHIQAENYTEAGFTLKMHASMLSWDQESLSFLPNSNNGKPEWQHKESLYHEILQYFDKGKCWEKGIPLCKELALLYETRRLDYNKLSEILVLEARFFQNILTQLRPEPEYFRVGFFGTGFPLFVRNKQFVYRGLEYERIGTFTQRLQNEFPSAQLLTNNNPPDELLLSSPDQYIQISTVRAIGDARPLKTATAPVPEKIARFYEVNDVKRFLYDRPIYKGPIDKDNEFKSLWIERTTLDISSSLPGILRWFEVIHKSVLEITPVEFACETMTNVAKELIDLIAQYRNDPKRNINPFSMRLQGIIDANVMGGICKYQEAFFTETFLSSPEGLSHQSSVYKLKCLILEQIKILEQALTLHGQLAPSGVQPLHLRLIECFSKLKQNISVIGNFKRQHSESIINTPLPPLPTENNVSNVENNVQPCIMNANRFEKQNYCGIYEDDDIYTRPSETLRPVETNNLNSCTDCTLKGSREDISCFCDEIDVPPISNQSCWQYLNLNVKTPDVPPKRQICFQDAPPLPPRGIYLDKRSSNPIISTITALDINGSTNHSISRRPHSASLYQQNQIPKENQKTNSKTSIFCENSMASYSVDFYSHNNDVVATLQDNESIHKSESFDDMPMSPPPVPPKLLFTDETNSFLDEQSNTHTSSTHQRDITSPKRDCFEPTSFGRI